MWLTGRALAVEYILRQNEGYSLPVNLFLAIPIAIILIVARSGTRKGLKK